MAASPQSEPASFAGVYDALYDDPAFRAAQLAFLGQVFGPPPARLLDAGCGTGAHLAGLAALGYTVVGLDADPRMLQVARRRLSTAGQPAALILGDLRVLPFAQAFDGIVCLESPLAYLLADDELDAALAGFHRCLRPGGRLVIDIFDYPRTLGEEALPPQTTRFSAPWGAVTVAEAHSYDRAAGIWTMRQAFKVNRGRGVERFTAAHRLRVRPVETYLAALEASGFTVTARRSTYPGIPASLADEQRVILVAQRDQAVKSTFSAVAQEFQM